jgi:hypothetical protein
MRRSVLLASLVLTAAACGSSAKVSAPAASGSSTTKAGTAMTEPAMTEPAMTDGALSVAYCTQAKAIGSITKARTDAMADTKSMGAAGGMKMFQDVQAKVTALAALAPDGLRADVTTLAAHLGLEAMAEGHKKADGTGAEAEMKQIDSQKAADDAAAGHVITATKTGCQVDLS